MDLITDGRLVRKITGTICSNLGVLRGVTLLAPSKLTHNLKATRVYYVGVKNFIFYRDLPLDIEGDKFNFEETYSEYNDREIPTRQKLIVFPGGKKEKRVFEFERKKYL